VRLLLLSSYDAHSHEQWHRCLREGTPDWDWSVLTLPPRHFSWRIRGNPLSWALEDRETLEGRFDLVLATSMVDLATLRGLVPSLARVPTALYFHENQFAYPEGQGEHSLLEAQIVSLYSALAADRLLFNSSWNRDSFLAGLSGLLQKLPDRVPGGVPDILADKSEILPVPVPVGSPTSRRGEGPLQVVWNHRWEYDKGPGLLLETVREAASAELVFNVVGQQFRERPAAFEELHSLLTETDSLGVWGYVTDRQAYWNLLGSCDVVLSTAAHDFQGLAVLEACRLGCTPLVPDGLAYPEWFAAGFLYREAEVAAHRLAAYAADKRAGRSLPTADVESLAPVALLPRYRVVLESLAA
jgi:glycosyltransferase involved in cell wall biosynthesis